MASKTELLHIKTSQEIYPFYEITPQKLDLEILLENKSNAILEIPFLYSGINGKMRILGPTMENVVDCILNHEVFTPFGNVAFEIRNSQGVASLLQYPLILETEFTLKNIAQAKRISSCIQEIHIGEQTYHVIFPPAPRNIEEWEKEEIEGFTDSRYLNNQGTEGEIILPYNAETLEEIGKQFQLIRFKFINLKNVPEVIKEAMNRVFNFEVI